MARPVSPTVQPRLVRYSVRNGTTNAPNLLRNVPKQRIHAGRGNARRLDKSVGSRFVGVGWVVFIENKFFSRLNVRRALPANRSAAFTPLQLTNVRSHKCF